MNLPEKETTGANCAYHPRLEDMPLDELIKLNARIKKQQEMVATELKKRIYNFEKRSKS